MTVLEGEAVTLLDSIHFADVNGWDRVVFESDSAVNGWDRVVFESDSATVVQALSSPGHGDSESMLLFLVLFIKLSLHSNFEVKFVKRQTNMIAHTLTKAVCYWASRRIFLLLSFLY
jgi:hypothetical protein